MKSGVLVKPILDTMSGIYLWGPNYIDGNEKYTGFFPRDHFGIVLKFNTRKLYPNLVYIITTNGLVGWCSEDLVEEI